MRWIVVGVLLVLWLAPVAEATTRLPLVFEVNRGQAPESTRLLAHGPGYALDLRRGGAVLRPQGVRIEFADARGDEPRGVRRLHGRVNYFYGRDARRWLRGVPTFAAVRYEAVWPGVDVLFHGRAQQLEFDFELAPGAEPERIALRLRGGRPVLERDGDLRIGPVRIHAPVAFQRRGGRRVAVASRFVLRRGGAVSVDVGDYDRRRPLVIDPALGYSTYLGGGSTDEATAVAVGPSGGTYIAGTAGSGFPTSAGADDTSYGGSTDGFVAKINPSLTGAASLIYATYLGGDDFDRADAIAVDSSGQAYVTGDTQSGDFPTTAGAFRTNFHGDTSAFVVKLAAAGDDLTYSTLMNGSGATSSGQSGGTGIGVDGSGRAYVGGFVNTVADYKTTAGAFQTTSSETLNSNDAFFAQLKADGSGLDYSTLFSGEDEDDALALAIDPAGAAYLTGFTYSNSLPTSAGAFQPTFTGCCGQWAAWVAKFDPSLSGNASRVYATYLGTNNFGNAIAADASGHAYVTGTTNGSFPVTAGAFQTTHGGDADAFAAKLGTGGGTLQYATYLGGSDNDLGLGVAVDGGGSAYVTGATSSDDFPVGGRPLFATRQGGEDAFVTRIGPAGAALSYSTYLGGSADERGNAIALDAAGDAHVAGKTSSDGQATSNAFQMARGGGQDAFLAKLIHTTRTVVTCTPGTTDIGQPTTCTATVTDSFNPPTTPTGTINFTASGAGVFGGAGTCTLVPGATGTASCSRNYTPSATGAQTVTATYGGDDGHAPSDGKDGIGVGTRPTQSSLTCQPAAIRVAQAATCTLTVDDVGTGSASTPTGTVSYSGDSFGTFSDAGGCTLSQSGGIGHAACSVSYIPSAVADGDHAISALYAGSASHSASHAGTSVSVSKRATMTVIGCLQIGAMAVGQTASCTVTVTDTDVGTKSAPLGFAAVSVTGGDGSSPRCMLQFLTPTSSRCATTYTPTAVGTGSHALTAAYSGDASHLDSTGSGTALLVAKRLTGTSVACDPAALHVGVASTCTATVTDITSGTATPPAGTVSIEDVTCTPAVTGATTASCSVQHTPAAAGDTTIDAAFSGDDTHSPSSGTTVVTASRRTTSTSLVCAPTSLTIGETATCTATVTDTDAGTAVTPTGSAGGCELADGACAFAYTPDAAGTHQVDASYAGDAIHEGSAASTTVDASAPPPPQATPTPTPSPLPPLPAPPPDPLLLVCDRVGVRLVDVTPTGRRVRLGGLASRRYTGQRVILRTGTTQVATTTVQPDGTFATTARAPRRAATPRYSATVAGHTSAALRLQRRLLLNAQVPAAAGVQISGRLVSARPSRRSLIVRRVTSCSTNPAVTARLKTDRRGRFKLTLARPTGTDELAFYRVTTATGGRTYTLPVVVRR